MPNFVPLSGWPQIKDLPDLQGRLDRIKKIEAWKADTTYIEETGAEIEIDNCLGVPANQLSLTFAAQQDLHGYSKPWAAGAGKNKLPMSVSAIKAANTTGVWTGNEYAINNGTFEILTDSANNVTGFKVNGTFSANTTFTIANYNCLLGADSYTFGAADHSDNAYGDNTHFYFLSNINGESAWAAQSNSAVSSRTFTVTDTTKGIRCAFYIVSGTSISNELSYPMIRLSSVTDDLFAPYTNICPITGKSSVSLTDTDGTETATKTVSLGSTLYGGSVDFMEGTASKTVENIASYDGETISEPWLSSMDEYTEGGTPTTGAQVVYTLETPAELTLTAAPLTMYRGTNTLSTSDGSINIKALTGRAF